MPRYPIYVGLLPPEAQQVIGKVHHNTQPALKLLENEGFTHRGYVDLFDAGPTVEAQLKQIKSVRQSHRITVTISSDSQLIGSSQLGICNCETEQFRATFSNQCYLDKQSNSLVITSAIADALQIKDGDSVRYLNLDKGAK